MDYFKIGRNVATIEHKLDATINTYESMLDSVENFDSIGAVKIAELSTEAQSAINASINAIMSAYGIEGEIALEGNLERLKTYSKKILDAMKTIMEKILSYLKKWIAQVLVWLQDTQESTEDLAEKLKSVNDNASITLAKGWTPSKTNKTPELFTGNPFVTFHDDIPSELKDMYLKYDPDNEKTDIYTKNTKAYFLNDRDRGFLDGITGKKDIYFMTGMANRGRVFLGVVEQREASGINIPTGESMFKILDFLNPYDFKEGKEYKVKDLKTDKKLLYDVLNLDGNKYRSAINDMHKGVQRQENELRTAISKLESTKDIAAYNRWVMTKTKVLQKTMFGLVGIRKDAIKCAKALIAT